MKSHISRDLTSPAPVPAQQAPNCNDCRTHEINRVTVGKFLLKSKYSRCLLVQAEITQVDCAETFL